MKIKHLFFISSIMVMIGIVVLSSAAPQVFALSVIDTINVGNQPRDIAVNPITNTIYVINSGGIVSVIDGFTNSVTDTISLGFNLGSMAVNPTTNTIYVTSEFSNKVLVIDGTDNTFVDTINVEDRPVQIAVNPATNTIYVIHPEDDMVSFIDGSNNSVLGTDISMHTPSDIAVNPTTNAIYIVNSDTTVEVYDGLNNAHIRTISLDHEPGFKKIAVNPITNTIYVVTFFGTVHVIDGSDKWHNSVTDLFLTGDRVFDIVVNPATNTIFVPHEIVGPGTVSVIDGTDNTFVDTINVADRPDQIAVNPVTNTIYVIHPEDDTVSVIGEESGLPGAKGFGKFGLAKTPLCHLDQVTGEFSTMAVSSKAANKHLNNHPGDYYGACFEPVPQCNVSPDPLQVSILPGTFVLATTNVGCQADTGSAQNIENNCAAQAVELLTPYAKGTFVVSPPPSFSTTFEFLIGSLTDPGPVLECTQTWETNSDILGIQQHVQDIQVEVFDAPVGCEDCDASAQNAFDACINLGGVALECGGFADTIHAACMGFNELTCDAEPICGDDVVEAPEDCDEGDNNSNDPNSICRLDCTLLICGDGILDTFTEECDDGISNNSDTTPDACRLACVEAYCGDDVVDPGNGEVCDGIFGPQPCNAITCIPDVIG